MPTCADIISAIEAIAPRSLQEAWDNTGWQVGHPDTPCTGALLCVDVTPEAVDEARALGCNLIISHHPLIFKGLKQIIGADIQQQAVLMAITGGITVYSCHTAIDNAEGGVSYEMAKRLGIDVLHTLEPIPGQPRAGAGIYGELHPGLTPESLIARIKEAFGTPTARCTHWQWSIPEGELITRVALCGGSGGSFIRNAIEAGAQAYISSDIKYHDFLDYGNSILLVDIGHFEAEKCTKDIFYQIIRQKFANFAVHKSSNQVNPIVYI